MKTAKLSTLLLLLALLNSACSDDGAKEKPDEKFIADNETFDFKEANLYLAGEAYFSNASRGYNLRNYIVTDGTFVSGNGWDLSHYTDATYVFAFQVYVPEGDDFIAGNFPSVDQFAAPEGNSLYFYGETTNESEYYQSTGGESTPNFVISGGMNDGQKMTIKFNGELSHWVQSEIWQETTFNGSILVTAIVEEVTPTNEAGR